METYLSANGNKAGQEASLVYQAIFRFGSEHTPL